MRLREEITDSPKALQSEAETLDVDAQPRLVLAILVVSTSLRLCRSHAVILR